MSDRFQWDQVPGGGEEILDEIVLTGVTFHLERMSHHHWWIGVHNEAGDNLHLNWHGGEVGVEEWGPDLRPGWKGVERIHREPLLYVCHQRWTTEDHVDHQCEVEGQEHRRHRCECGRTKAAEKAGEGRP